MYVVFAFNDHIPVQRYRPFITHTQQRRGCIIFQADDNSKQSWNTHDHSRSKIQIYDLGEWWDLRGAISMRRLGRYPGTHVAPQCSQLAPMTLTEIAAAHAKIVNRNTVVKALVDCTFTNDQPSAILDLCKIITYRFCLDSSGTWQLLHAVLSKQRFPSPQYRGQQHRHDRGAQFLQRDYTYRQIIVSPDHVEATTCVTTVGSTVIKLYRSVSVLLCNFIQKWRIYRWAIFPICEVFVDDPFVVSATASQYRRKIFGRACLQLCKQLCSIIPKPSKFTDGPKYVICIGHVNYAERVYQLGKIVPSRRKAATPQFASNSFVPFCKWSEFQQVPPFTEVIDWYLIVRLALWSCVFQDYLLLLSASYVVS